LTCHARGASAGSLSSAGSCAVGILLSERRSATRYGQRGLVETRLLASQQRSWGSFPFAGLLPLRRRRRRFRRGLSRMPFTRVFLHPTVFAELADRCFLEGKSATDREKPRVRASGHRPPDRSAPSPTRRRCAILPWALSSLRVSGAFDSAHRRGFAFRRYR